MPSRSAHVLLGIRNNSSGQAWRPLAVGHPNGVATADFHPSCHAFLEPKAFVTYGQNVGKKDQPTLWATGRLFAAKHSRSLVEV
jgi:hypothetical protein